MSENIHATQEWVNSNYVDNTTYMKQIGDIEKNTILQIQNIDNRVASLEDDFEDLVDDGNPDNKFSNALKGTTRGEVIEITDISPIEHNMAVSVKGKNLIPYPPLKIVGSIYTDNGDGTYTVNGTGDGKTYYNISFITSNLGDYLIDGKTYTMSFKVTNVPANATVAAQIRKYDKTALTNKWEGASFSSSTTESFKSISFTVDKAKYDYIDLFIQINPTTATFENMVLSPMLEEGSTATSYTPYIDISTVKLLKQGKNLINNTLKSQTINGVEVTVNDDKSITLNGTSSEMSYLTLGTIDGMTEKCFLSGCPSGGGATTYCIYLYAQREDGTRHYVYDTGSGKIAEMEKGLTYQIRLSFNSTFNNVVFKPMLALGTSATEYEPYIEPVIYDVPTDGIVEGVTSLYPNTTLYTDASGAVIECEYNKDINKAFAELQNAIISLGGNV